MMTSAISSVLSLQLGRARGGVSCDATAEPTAAATAKCLARSVRSVWEYGTHAWIKHEVDHEVSLTVR